MTKRWAASENIPLAMIQKPDLIKLNPLSKKLILLAFAWPAEISL